ncbi:MAG: DUF4129 domain-containing protein [Candidatus Hydrogenedentes bacterium]|nr:DUF4129 domain-containing protein [Candidatus Hydrogenedentota bacterium]
MNGNSTKFPPPASGGNGYPDEGATDFHSLLESEAAALAGPSTLQAQPKRAMESTDFQSLKRASTVDPKLYQAQSWTDFSLAFTTPLMILVMISSVIFFLLDVRFVYTEVHDWNLRIFAIAFILGVVALNRLIARDGKEESFIYVIALMGASAMYTMTTTGAYDVGSVARGFMNSPWIALAFNSAIIAFIWWFTNRLTHECCVDDNPFAGAIGMLTGTALKFRRAIRGASGPASNRTMLADGLIDMEAVDPLDWKAPVKKPKFNLDAMSEKLPRRHPGISIFYFSVPVMIVFALGQRVVQHGGEAMLMAGHFYVGCYTVAALSLLMLSSLAGLREFFRARRVRLPGALGPYWLGLGFIMIAIVGFGATALPWPALPPIAYVGEHEYDPWRRDTSFQLRSVVSPAVDVIAQNRVIEHIGTGVLIMLGLFIAYGALRGVGSIAVRMARNRRRYPQFIIRFFNWLESFLDSIIRVPELPTIRRRRRISRASSWSARIANPMAQPGSSAHSAIEGCYDALCALAHDYGVPRKIGQTPYEFIASFPNELKSIREEAMELTDLYVVSAYSKIEIDDRIQDRLRKFWMTFDRLRNRVIR